MLSSQMSRYRGVLRLLSVNDVYSPLPNPSDGVGGWANLDTLIRRHRTPNSLLCINGDFLGGSALSEHHQGRNVISIMNQIGTDLVCIGNHEFDFGQNGLKDRMKESNFIWLGSNVREKTKNEKGEEEERLFENVQDLHQIHMTLQRVEEDNQANSTNSPSSSTATPNTPSPFPSQTTASIGLFGLCTEATPQLSWPGPDVTFRSVDEVARESIQRLKGVQPIREGEISFMQLPRTNANATHNSNGKVESTSSSSSSSSSSNSSSSSSLTFVPSDAVIAITHLPNIHDRQLARTHSSTIQLILGGHDHDAIASQENGVLIFKAGQNAEFLGVIDLEIEVTLTLAPSNHKEEHASTAPFIQASTPTPIFTRQTSVFPSWQMISNRGYPPNSTILDLIHQSIKEMEASQADEDPNEIICTIGAPAELPSGVTTLSPDVKQHLLVTKTSCVRKSTASFAHLVADAMAYHYREDGCDGAIINGGFIRGDKTYAQGAELTLRDIRSEVRL